MDAIAVIATIGGIALLIGIFGGGVKAKEVEIPLIPPFIRILSAITGIVLLGITIWLSIGSSTPTIPPTNVLATAAISTALEVTPSITNSPAQNTPQPTNSPIPISTNVLSTNTPVNISASDSTNWVFTLEYRFADRFWTSGTRWYTLSWTCLGESPSKAKHNFTVSDDFPLIPGDVYLQSSVLRRGDPWGTQVNGINPSQSTVASVVWEKITKTEADWRVSNCIGNVTSDSGTVTILTGKLFQH